MIRVNPRVAIVWSETVMRKDFGMKTVMALFKCTYHFCLVIISNVSKKGKLKFHAYEQVIDYHVRSKNAIIHYVKFMCIPIGQFSGVSCMGTAKIRIC